MTTQIPDLLIYKGKRYTIDHTPLESAWQEGDSSKPKFDFRVTSNWRGYVATWRVEEENESTDGTHLLLRNLAGGTVDGEPISHMAALGYDESECDGTEEIIADWFSGAINAGRGTLLYSKPMTTRALHTEMLHLQVHRGKVLNLRETHYTEADVERFFPAIPPVNENELPNFLRRTPVETSQTEEEGLCSVSRHRFVADDSMQKNEKVRQEDLTVIYRHACAINVIFNAVHQRIESESANAQNVLKSLFKKSVPQTELHAWAVAVRKQFDTIDEPYKVFSTKHGIPRRGQCGELTDQVFRLLYLLREAIDCLVERQKALCNPSNGLPLSWEMFKDLNSRYELARSDLAEGLETLSGKFGKQ